MKPSQRNKYQRELKEAQIEARKITRLLEKYDPCSFVYGQLHNRLNQQNSIISRSKLALSRTTQPNGV